MHPTPPVVLITGASRGIGAAAAVAFGRAGWRVAITARSLTEGAEHAHQLRRPDGSLMAGSLASTSLAVQATGSPVFAHAMDLMDTASMDRALDATVSHFGRIDLLINNAVYQDREMNALLLDLEALGVDLDNLEGMTWGPRLPTGQPTLILVSDNNFSGRQVTQFLAFAWSD